MNIQLPWFRAPQYSVMSCQGPRVENQDNYLIRKPNGHCHMLLNSQPISRKSSIRSYRKWRFAVFDGMGGHAIVPAILKLAAILLAELPIATNVNDLKEVVLNLHEKLYQEFHFLNSQASPGTTLALVELDLKRQSALIAHVGDSRIYIRRSGEKWQQCTQDHINSTFMARLDSHLSTKPTAQNKNEPLAQALGFGSFAVFPEYDILTRKYDKNIRLDIDNPKASDNDVRMLEVPPHTLILIASDGIWHTNQDGDLPLPHTAQSAEDFIRHTELSGARDNMTALLIET